MSLNSLGVRQSELGQREAAVASTDEAVDVYRKLATARPDAFLPDLATSLTNLGQRQSELGQHDAALASTQEALDALWPHFVALPAAHEHLAKEILRNLPIRLIALGREPPPGLLVRIAIHQEISSRGDPEGQ
jgi:tetratricopeptide (TPR) repeat protein